MPTFFFDIEADDGGPGGQESSAPKAAEILARHLHERIKETSRRQMLPPEREEAEEAAAYPIQIGTIAPKTDR